MISNWKKTQLKNIKPSEIVCVCWLSEEKENDKDHENKKETKIEMKKEEKNQQWTFDWDYYTIFFIHLKFVTQHFLQ